LGARLAANGTIWEYASPGRSVSFASVASIYALS